MKNLLQIYSYSRNVGSRQIFYDLRDVPFFSEHGGLFHAPYTVKVLFCTSSVVSESLNCVL